MAESLPHVLTLYQNGRHVLLRPPRRELLERGPPVSVREALRRFERVEAQTVADALRKAQELGITVPME